MTKKAAAKTVDPKDKDNGKEDEGEALRGNARHDKAVAEFKAVSRRFLTGGATRAELEAARVRGG